MSTSFLLGLSLSIAQTIPDSTFTNRGDGRLAIGAAIAVSAAAVFDERIARWTQRPSIQGDSSRHDLVRTLTKVNEIPLTIAAVTTYGVGRLTGSHTVSDVGAHLTAALVATEIVAELVRVGVGRARPRASPNDAFQFDPGRGLSRFESRSFPSMHAAVAFATAAALSEEMRLRDAPARIVASPLLFAAATIPGFTRLYQHWASDVLAGSVVGAFLGARVVRYAHGRRTVIDRLLLRPYDAGDGRTAWIVGVTMVR
jgi:membrane-associated phospholipid phosphatase